MNRAEETGKLPTSLHCWKANLTSSPLQSTPYPTDALRALAMHCQGLDRRVTGRTQPGPQAILDAVKRVGWVQIDTLQMVQRSQYLTMWSRLGCYDTADFDRLVFDDGNASSENGRQLFEYWMHAACIIPLTEYRYKLPAMRDHRDGEVGWRRSWAEQPENLKLVGDVLRFIEKNGCRRSADFESNEKRRGPWWDWKPAKRALEHLYNSGELVIANRLKFQRVYDLPERVIPDWVDTSMPDRDEAGSHLLEISLRALGVCSPAQVGDYCHMKRTESRPLVEALVKCGAFVRLKGQMADGSVRDLLTHRDNVGLLRQAADGALAPALTTFLSPFDSLFWARDRDMQFWGFRQILESYKPERIREWGYFCLPILHKGRLVGRFDPKLERKEKTLRLKKLFLEPGVQPEDELVADVADAMRDFLAFHDADTLVIEKSTPAVFRRKLMRAL